MGDNLFGDIEWEDISSTPSWRSFAAQMDAEFKAIIWHNYSQKEVNDLENWAREIKALWETGE